MEQVRCRFATSMMSRKRSASGAPRHRSAKAGSPAVWAMAAKVRRYAPRLSRLNRTTNIAEQGNCAGGKATGGASLAIINSSLPDPSSTASLTNTPGSNSVAPAICLCFKLLPRASTFSPWRPAPWRATWARTSFPSAAADTSITSELWTAWSNSSQHS